MELKTSLRNLLRTRGMTIVALSRATGVPVQTLHGWLQGSEPKSIRQLKKVADFLNVDLTEMCFGPPPRPALNSINDFEEEINAGIFEVVLRRIKK